MPRDAGPCLGFGASLCTGGERRGDWLEMVQGVATREAAGVNMVKKTGSKEEREELRSIRT